MSLFQCRPQQQLSAVREFMNDEVLWAWGNFPSIDVSEDADKFTVKADLPGVPREDVKLSIDDGVLTIEGERKTDEESKSVNYHRIERVYGRFSRSLNLGMSLNADLINAAYNNGILTITLPKLEKAKARSIVIN